MQSFNIENYIHKLEKENIELQQKWLDESYEKAKCIKSLDDKNKEINYLSEQIQELKIELDTPESVVLDKLDEAKEIIRALLFHLNKDTFAVIYETKKESINRAEQFLGELDETIRV